MARHDEEREKRLAEALRQNLKRRKAQARGGDEGESVPSPPLPAAPDGSLPLPEGGEGTS